MSKRKSGGLTRNVIADIEKLGAKYGVPKPHLHVSDPIPDRETLEQGFSNRFNVYARYPGHPDHQRVEKWLAESEGGAAFRLRADGMSGIWPILFSAGELRGSKIIEILPLYGPTDGLLAMLEKSKRHNFRRKKLYANDPDLISKLEGSIDSDTTAVILETAGNPTLTFPDIETMENLCHNHPHGNPFFIIDNTFHFGLFKGFKWGADAIVGSGTKYLVGESSWPLGYFGVSEKCYTECPQLWQEANVWANDMGGSAGVIESWITGSFSVNEVAERVKKHSRNALEVANFLEEHPLVEKVIYPGLQSYPHRPNILKYLELIDNEYFFGGMISFYIKDATSSETEALLYHLTAHTNIKYQASLGGPGNMIESPLLLSHRNMDAADAEKCGITKNNLRLSVGLGDSDDTIRELDMAFWTVLR